MAALLRCPGAADPPPAQVRGALALAFSGAASSTGVPPPPPAVDYFRAVVARCAGRVKGQQARLDPPPGLYDAADLLQGVAIAAPGPADRAAARAALLAFLLDCPLGPRRLAAHVERALANLEYEHADGRAAAARLVRALAEAFPPALRADWAPGLHLPLAARLVAEAEPGPRAAAAAALQAVVRGVPPAVADRLAGFAAAWMGGGGGKAGSSAAPPDPRRARAGAAALALQVAVEGPAGARHARLALPPTLAMLEAAVAAMEDEDGGRGGDGRGSADGGPGWEATYAALSLLEAFAQAAPAALAWADPAGRRAWLLAARLALYPHAWVRRAAARLVGRALGERDAGEGLLAEDGGAVGGPAAAGLPPARVLARAALSSAQDPSAADDPGLLAQACKNVVFLSAALFDLDQAAGLVPGSGRGGGGGGDDAPSDDDDDDDEATPHPARTGLTLLGLCRAAARLADGRPGGGRGAPSSSDPAALPQRLAGLRLIAALTARLGPDRAAPYLPTLLTPAFRITEGGAPAPPEAVALTAEVLDAVRAAAGAGAALAGYNAARAAVLAARTARKAAKAVHALVSPEAAAQDRLRKQARRAASRKKKMEEVTRLRAAGVAVKNKSGRRQQAGVRREE